MCVFDKLCRALAWTKTKYAGLADRLDVSPVQQHVHMTGLVERTVAPEILAPQRCQPGAALRRGHAGEVLGIAPDRLRTSERAPVMAIAPARGSYNAPTAGGHALAQMFAVQ